MELSELPKACSFELNEVVCCFMAPLCPTELLALFIYSSVLFPAVCTNEHRLKLSCWHSKCHRGENNHPVLLVFLQCTTALEWEALLQCCSESAQAWPHAYDLIPFALSPIDLWFCRDCLFGKAKLYAVIMIPLVWSKLEVSVGCNVTHIGFKWLQSTLWMQPINFHYKEEVFSGTFELDTAFFANTGTSQLHCKVFHPFHGLIPALT